MTSDLKTCNKDIILVTGFGPFQFHTINASWEAVKLLDNHSNNDYLIVTEQIPVEYEEVDKKLPILWKELEPKLVVHVGVSHLAEKITIETKASRSGYLSADAGGNYCKEGVCCTLKDSEEILHTGLNIDTICKEFNTNSNHVQACVSTHAGRYLCEYIYFKSLSFNQDSTVFVHVPMLNTPYTVEELADALIKIIDMAYKQLSEKDVIQAQNNV